MRELLTETRLVVVPLIVEVVPVHIRNLDVAVEIRRVKPAIVVSDESVQYHLFHHPLKAYANLKVEFYSAFLMHQYRTPSTFIFY